MRIIEVTLHWCMQSGRPETITLNWGNSNPIRRWVWDWLRPICICITFSLSFFPVMLLLSCGVPVYPPYYGSCVQIPILDISKDSNLSLGAKSDCKEWTCKMSSSGLLAGWLVLWLLLLIVVKSLTHIWLFATPWTVAHQAPPSMGFSRQEYWSGLSITDSKWHTNKPLVCYNNLIVKFFPSHKQVESTHSFHWTI